MNNFPAFPSQERDAQGNPSGSHEYGMTMRDYFAASALAALIQTGDAHNNITRDDIVGEAFNYADAMLACRVPPQPIASAFVPREVADGLAQFLELWFHEHGCDCEYPEHACDCGALEFEEEKQQALAAYRAKGDKA